MGKWAQLWTPAGPALADAMDVQIITASGQWVNPSPGKRRLIWARVVGAGGGSGSGRRGAAGTVRSGGGGAAAGAVMEAWCFSDSLPELVNVIVGAGGLPGAAVTADNTSGNPGTAGGNTWWGNFVARGGLPGAGGTTSTALGGASTANSCVIGLAAAGNLAGAAASATGGAGIAAPTSNLLLPSGGGSGGGLTSSNAESAGGNGGMVGIGAGGAVFGAGTGFGIASGGFIGQPNGRDGDSMESPYTGTRWDVGLGLGGGGGASGRTSPGRGGRGGFPGGGAGGSGASENGVVAPEGNYGGDGLVIVVVF